jgi:uncharacterized protein YegL
MLRRLPVYLLLDVSESMIGPPLESLQEGVKLMVRTLRQNPYALESLYMAVITFAGRAETAVPLTELCAFSAPSLSAGPGTALGAALKLCRESIARDVVVTTPERKGDFKPLVFVMTDGEPTDDWQKAAKELREARPRPSVVAVGCGDEADFDVLRQISGSDAVRVNDLAAESVQALFAWVSASLGATSKAAGDAGPGPDITKAPLAGGLTLVKDGDKAPAKAKPRLFLRVRCLSSQNNYLSVYRDDGSGRVYRPLSAHPVTRDFAREDGQPAPEIAGAGFTGHPKCPYCGSSTLFVCQFCKSVCCIDPAATSVYCPGCKKKYGLQGVSSVNLRPSRG